jgi:hypothetical protein
MNVLVMILMVNANEYNTTLVKLKRYRHIDTLVQDATVKLNPAG